MLRSLVILFLLWLLFFLKGYVFLDPDFGFHMRTGEMILQSGIPRADVLSYTMPGFPLIDHEWLLDVTLVVLYPLIGMSGLSAIAATMAVSVLVLSLVSAGRSIRSLQYPAVAIPILLASAVLLPFAGVRPQVISWFFLVTLYWLLADARSWNKRRFLVPFLFLVWANMHAGFAVGLVLLFIQGIIKTRGIVIFLLSLAATFANPYGFRLHQEIWGALANPQFRWTIAEWHPAVLYVDFGLIVFVSLSLVFIVLYRKRFTVLSHALYTIFLLAAISSQRHIPLWIIVALPMTIYAITLFIREVTHSVDGRRRWKQIHPYIITTVLVLVTYETFTSLTGALAWREERGYPIRALLYLREHPSSGHLFSYFAWGGYLDWKLPEKKVFIDGRMAGWKQVGMSGERNVVFDEYLDVTFGEIPISSIVDRYGIDTVLWPIDDISARYTLLDRLEEYMEREVFHSQKKKHSHIVQQLITKGWDVVWKDEVSVVLRKRKVTYRSDQEAISY